MLWGLFVYKEGGCCGYFIFQNFFFGFVDVYLGYFVLDCSFKFFGMENGIIFDSQLIVLFSSGLNVFVKYV